MAKNLCSFLGANTPVGFYSLFDELYNPFLDCRAYIIKGGPGCGKSTLMKKLACRAQQLGYTAERVLCSSDPDSLDAVIIPQRGLCVADGTSPHLLEPRFPGAAENIINLGAFWNERELREKGDRIRSLTIENSLYHRRSSRYLAAAGGVLTDSLRLLSPYIDLEKLNGYALRFCRREITEKKPHAPGRKSRRFISAITPKGVIFLDDTVKALSGRVIGISDEYSEVSSLLIGRIAELMCKSGVDVTVCPCPMRPDSFEHIIIEKLSLSLITLKSSHPTALKCDRIIHASRFLDPQALKRHKNRLSFNRKLAGELIGQSIEMLKAAKQVHDRLERLYIESMDFSRLNEVEIEL